MRPPHNYDSNLLSEIFAYVFLFIVYIGSPILCIDLILQGNWIYGISYLQLPVVFTLVMFQLAKI